MISRRSIEFRLATWYSLLLLAGLVSLAAVLWFGVNYSMVSAVDDILTARVNHLTNLIDAEFGGTVSPPDQQQSGNEFRGTVDGLDLESEWFSIDGTRVYFTPETQFESKTGSFGPSHLENGQYVELEVAQRNDQWVASEVSLETGLEQELFEELHEYSLAVPEGHLIQIRTEGGRQIIPSRPDPTTQPMVPWQGIGSDDLGVRTIEVNGSLFRVLGGRALLAGSSHRVQVASSLASVVATRERLISWLLRSIPIGVLVSFAGGYVISRRALRPVEDVAHIASRMDVTRLAERLPVAPTGDVVQTLAETFNEMLSRLETAVKRLRQFTADASHELRSPVSVIRTTAELAIREGRTQDDLRKDMKEIHDEAKRLSELIEDLLTLARTDDARAAPTAKVDLGALADSLCNQYQRRKNGRTLEWHVGRSNLTVQGHEQSLRRLLIILLDNAVQHTPTDASIQVSVRGNTDQLVFSVADEGEGIPPQELTRIFDRFYRVDPARNRAKGGVGLGLSIAKWISESHGGTITVSSEIGEGSVFQVSLPRNGIVTLSALISIW